ncbi:MAG: thioredoxin family protein [Flavobacteriales bacterium]|nr:thioredoxin family protein [Flavobacteriales bacterium]
MKKIMFLFVMSWLIFNMSYAQKLKSIEIGEVFPISHIDHPMKSIKGKEHRISQHLNNDGLIIIFTSNNCPFVEAWEDRYKIVENLCQRYNLDMLYINSNQKRRDGDDSYKAMQAHAKKKGYSYEYLLDEQSELANTLGAKTTPHVFMFDKSSKLVYKGAIDDNYQSVDDVNNFYLKNAIRSLSADKVIEISKTKAIGCSIKRYDP